VWLSVAACAAASLFALAGRHAMESSNRAVGLMMEMADIEAIAAADNVPLEDALAELRRHGLTGVAITEDTIGDLVRKGRIVFTTNGSALTINAVGDEASRWRRPTGGDPRYIGFQYNPELYHLDRVAKALARRGFFDLGVVNVPAGARYPTSITVDRDEPFDVSAVPVGIDPRHAYLATQAGLVVVARHFNEVGADEDTIVRTITESHYVGATAFLIGGDQALGNRDLLEATAETLRGRKLHYLSPEFATLGGDARLRKALAAQTLRLHSISQLEAETMSQAELDERFSKAYRERSVRWLLLRPTSKASRRAVVQASATLASLKDAIAGVGGVVQEPRPFDNPGTSPWLLGAIAALALPAVVWTLFAAFGFNWFSWAASFLALALSGAAFVGSMREYAALMVAVALPVTGFLVAVPAEGKRSRRYPLAAYLVMSLFSLIAGMAVGGMLSGVEYTIRAMQFSGVKAALFLPVLVVGWVLLARQGPWRETFNRPVSWAAATVAILGLALVAMLALRSGNENPSAVSSMELQVRALLDNLLHVRPRTKEVVFGHPALVLGLCLLAFRPGWRGWAALLLVAGMVGQTSIVNTLCHLHTPVLLSLTRVGVGLALGGIIGLLAWVVTDRLTRPKEAPN
jgi:hypothetical protein